jgi:hypothetical protein
MGADPGTGVGVGVQLAEHIASAVM